MLNKGDRVVMFGCMEAEIHDGKIWTCETDEFVKGEGALKQHLVFLEGYSGSFITKYLAKYTTPKKVLEIYAATEEENEAAIRELDKQLIQLKKELGKEVDAL